MPNLHKNVTHNGQFLSILSLSRNFNITNKQNNF